MRLRADTINDLAVGVHGVDKVDKPLRLRVHAVEAEGTITGEWGSLRLAVGRGDVLEVVDVEDRIRIRRARRGERNVHEARTEHFRKHGRAHGAIFVEHLVDDVPRANLALIAARDVGNVVLDRGREGGLVRDLRDPRRELRVPDCTHALYDQHACRKAKRRYTPRV